MYKGELPEKHTYNNSSSSEESSSSSSSSNNSSARHPGLPLPDMDIVMGKEEKEEHEEQQQQQQQQRKLFLTVPGRESPSGAGLLLRQWEGVEGEDDPSSLPPSPSSSSPSSKPSTSVFGNFFSGKSMALSRFLLTPIAAATATATSTAIAAVSAPVLLIKGAGRVAGAVGRSLLRADSYLFEEVTKGEIQGGEGIEATMKEGRQGGKEEEQRLVRRQWRWRNVLVRGCFYVYLGWTVRRAWGR